jgi:SP family general alpha glucoside:H+ symporter-like MFS transporter
MGATRFLRDGSRVCRTECSAERSLGCSVGCISWCLVQLTIVNGYVSERFGYRYTVMACLVFLSGVVAIFFTAPNIKVLLVAEILAGIPWGESELQGPVDVSYQQVFSRPSASPTPLKSVPLPCGATSHATSTCAGVSVSSCAFAVSRCMRLADLQRHRRDQIHAWPDRRVGIPHPVRSSVE